MKSVLALALLAPIAANAAEPAGARAFATRLLTAEAHEDAAEVDFRDYLTARFRKAVELDTPDGEIGMLDHDPVCMCQDAQGIRFAVLSVEGTADAATIKVMAAGQKARWTLAKEHGAWKIADIAEAGWMHGGSILAALERSNAKQAKR